MPLLPSFLELVEGSGLNEWISVVSLTTTVVFGLLAVFFYFRSRKMKLPRYSVRSTNIVRDLRSRFPSVQVIYSGQPIENLTASKILFWNAGRDTIHSQDIASADPLSFRVKQECKILDAKILYAKNPANMFSLTTAVDGSYAALGFHYVDRGDGVVM